MCVTKHVRHIFFTKLQKVVSKGSIFIVAAYNPVLIILYGCPADQAPVSTVSINLDTD